jgi:hypothetical protein
MAAESTVLRQVWLALGRFSRLFRTNSGKAWVSGAGPAKRLTDGSVLVPAGRPVALGLSLVNGDPVNGQSDLQGWTLVRVTPQMVGNVYPIYTAIETKRSKGGKTSSDQANFIDQVKNAGGIAGVANSVEAALQIFRDWFKANGAKTP